MKFLRTQMLLHRPRYPGQCNVTRNGWILCAFRPTAQFYLFKDELLLVGQVVSDTLAYTLVLIEL